METVQMLRGYREMIYAASSKLRCSDAGVAVTLSLFEPYQFVIWSLDKDRKFQSHELDVLSTNQERLEAHLDGFMENLELAARCG